jgi:hypothetical protein
VGASQPSEGVYFVEVALTFKDDKHSRMPNIFKHALLDLGKGMSLQPTGWQHFDQRIHTHCTLNWGHRPKPNECMASSEMDILCLVEEGEASKRPYLTCNHFPQSQYLTVKDQLCRTLRKYRNRYGTAYDFVPLTFILPNEYSKFLDASCSTTSQHFG